MEFIPVKMPREFVIKFVGGDIPGMDNALERDGQPVDAIHDFSRPLIVVPVAKMGVRDLSKIEMNVLEILGMDDMPSPRPKKEDKNEQTTKSFFDHGDSSRVQIPFPHFFQPIADKNILPAL
jgi:hypothetical protein